MLPATFEYSRTRDYSVLKDQTSAEDLPRFRAQVPGWVWLILPYALMLVCFLAVPLANIGLLSFYTHSAERIWLPIVTLDNFGHVHPMAPLPIHREVTLRCRSRARGRPSVTIEVPWSQWARR